METIKDLTGVAAIIGLLAATALLPQPEPNTPSPTEIQQSIETETGITAPHQALEELTGHSFTYY